MNNAILATEQHTASKFFFYDKCRFIAIFVWIFTGFILWGISGKMMSSAERSSGDPLVDYHHYSFNGAKNLEDVSPWRQYWIEYYTAVDTYNYRTSAGVASVSSRSDLDAVLMAVGSILMFVVIYLFSTTLDKTVRQGGQNSIGARMLFWVLLVAAFAPQICKAEFLYWVSQ